MGAEKPHGGKTGQIVLVDEENGSVVGELGDHFNVVESSDVKHGSKRTFLSFFSPGLLICPLLTFPRLSRSRDYSTSRTRWSEYRCVHRHP